MLYPAALACENSEILGDKSAWHHRPGFLWSAGVSGHFLGGLSESVFSLICHWAGLGTGWRSLWSQTTRKDLNGLEWRWITLRDFYLKPRKAKSTKPSLRLLKATTCLESWMYFKFDILFILPYSGKVNVFCFFLRLCLGGLLQIGTAVSRFPAGILASCNAARWQFIKKLREMSSDSCDWEDLKEAPIE